MLLSPPFLSKVDLHVQFDHPLGKKRARDSWEKYWGRGRGVLASEGPEICAQNRLPIPAGRRRESKLTCSPSTWGLLLYYLVRDISGKTDCRGNVCLTFEHTFLLKHDHTKPRASVELRGWPALPLSSPETQSNLPHLSGPQFPHL